MLSSVKIFTITRSGNVCIGNGKYDRILKVMKLVYGEESMDLISIMVPMAITDNLPCGVNLLKKLGG